MRRGDTQGVTAFFHTSAAFREEKRVEESTLVFEIKRQKQKFYRTWQLRTRIVPKCRDIRTPCKGYAHRGFVGTAPFDLSDIVEAIDEV